MWKRIAVTLWLCACATIAAADGDGPGYTLTVTRVRDAGFDVELCVREWNVTREGAFTRIEIPGAGETGDVGAPILPTIRRWMHVPDGARAHVRIFDMETESTPVGLISPRQAMTTDLEQPAAFAFDPNAYDGARPNSELVRVGRFAVMAGVPVATLIFDPVVYDPTSGEANVVTRLRARVSFSESGQDSLRISPSRRDRLAATLLNFDPRRVAPPTRADAPAALVLYDDAFDGDPSLAALIEAHEAEGVVEAVAVADGAEASAVYQTILDAYLATDPPTLQTVLIVGDAGATGVPFLMGTHGRVADAPYGFLDGDDFLADVDLGRLPAQNAEDLAVMTDKTLAWLDGELDGEWLRRALLIAHKQGYPLKYTEACEQIRTAHYALDPPEFVTIYGGEGATNATLRDAINSGAMLTTYRGHGLIDRWAEWSWNGEDFDLDDVAAIDTAGRPGVVLDVACDNADLGQAETSFAEGWLAHPDAAVAFLGSIYASYTIPNNEFSRFLFSSIYDDGLSRLGDILAASNADLAAYYADDDFYRPYAEKNIEMYLWLGDPAITLPIDLLVAADSLLARAMSPRSVRLTWNDRALDESGYRIWRQSEHEKSARIVGAVGPDRERFEDGLVRPGFRYTYWVEVWRDVDAKISRQAAAVRVPPSR